MKKTSKKDYSAMIKDYIKDKLKDFLEDLDFNMSYNNSQFIFFVKDVEIRSDLLKKYEIPLELSKGRVDQIKLIVIIYLTKYKLNKHYIFYFSYLLTYLLTYLLIILGFRLI